MWQKEYKKDKFYWGLKPEEGLIEAIQYAPAGIALDIGAGEGRNSIFLAKNGFKVEAIDTIKEGLEKCKKITGKYNLPIKTKVIDIRRFEFDKNKFSLILSIVTIDFLKFSEIKKIITQVKESLKRGGIFYLVVFSINDPAIKVCKKKSKVIEHNTFYIAKSKTFRHFFEKKELIDLLNDFKIIKLKKEKIKDSHGGRGTHFHNIIKVIAKK